MIEKKLSSGLRRQSSESKLACFIKPNKQNVSVINLSKNSTFPSVKITVDTLIDVRNETSKHHFLTDKRNTTLHRDVNVPVRFRGHSSELSVANHSSRPTLSHIKCVSDTMAISK